MINFVIFIYFVVGVVVCLRCFSKCIPVDNWGRWRWVLLVGALTFMGAYVWPAVFMLARMYRSIDE